MANKTVAAKAGKLSLTRAAAELGHDRTVLRRAIERGDVRADKVDREFLIDPAELDRVRRRYECAQLGCEDVAVGESVFCSWACQRAGRSRPAEERERIAETKRRREKAIVRDLASRGLAPPSVAAPACDYSPHSFRGRPCASATACLIAGARRRSRSCV
jgi:hypothetical protein